MKLEVQISEMRKHGVLIATPAYGGMVTVDYALSCIQLHEEFARREIPIRFNMIRNESLVTRARNNLVKMFTQSKDLDRLLFIDADVGFNPSDVFLLLALSTKKEYDVICGSYPKKAIDWKVIKAAVEQGIEANDLERFVGNPVLNLPADRPKRININEPVEVLDTGTGFMMIKKEVIEKMIDAYPETAYTPDYVLSNPVFDDSEDKSVYALFDTGIVENKTGLKCGEGKKRYLSEDYLFCERWRNIGGKIHVVPSINLTHSGTYKFRGDLPNTYRLNDMITKSRQSKADSSSQEVKPPVNYKDAEES